MFTTHQYLLRYSRISDFILEFYHLNFLSLESSRTAPRPPHWSTLSFKKKSIQVSTRSKGESKKKKEKNIPQKRLTETKQRRVTRKAREIQNGSGNRRWAGSNSPGQRRSFPSRVRTTPSKSSWRQMEDQQTWPRDDEQLRRPKYHEQQQQVPNEPKQTSSDGGCQRKTKWVRNVDKLEQRKNPKGSKKKQTMRDQGIYRSYKRPTGRQRA